MTVKITMDNEEFIVEIKDEEWFEASYEEKEILCVCELLEKGKLHLEWEEV